MGYTHDKVLTCRKGCEDCHNSPRVGHGCKVKPCDLMIVNSFNTPNDEGRFLHSVGGIFTKDDIHGIGPTLKRMFDLPEASADSDVYLTNAVKCPPKNLIRDGKRLDMEPSIITTRMCVRTHLLAEIIRFQPKVIFGIGGLAALALIENLRYRHDQDVTLNSMMFQPTNSVRRFGRVVLAPLPIKDKHPEWEKVCVEQINLARASEAELPVEQLRAKQPALMGA